MKTFKKVFAFMLAAIMVLAMTCTAFAEETKQTVDSEKGGSYTITVKNATIGETYTVYKVFNATYAAGTDGTDGNIAYTLQKGQTIEEDNKYFEVISGTDGIKVRDNVDTKELTKYLKTNYAADAYKVVSTPENGATESVVEFINLEGGYYLVTSTLNDGAAVTLTSVGPNADIIDKNQDGPNWPEDPNGGKKIIDENGDPIEMKEVDGKPANSAAYGDKLHFQLKLATTNFEGEEFINNYYIKDEIGAGLSYVADTIEVYVGEAVEKDKLEITDYTVTLGADGKSFVISIPWINNTTLTDLAPEDVDFKYASPSSIIVRYDVTVDNNADVATALTNKANFATTTGTTTTPPGDDGYKSETEKETNTYTFALGLQKVDGSQEPLAGAKFHVRFVDGAYIKATRGTDGVYTYTGTTTDPDDATKFETVEGTGQILIKGVKEGSYEAVETDAPAGYNKLTSPTAPIAPTVTSISTNVETVTVWFDKDGNVVSKDSTVEKTNKEFTFADKVTSITVVNKAGTELPSTGGIGTTIFYVVGGLLVAGAGILLVTRKRMSRV